MHVVPHFQLSYSGQPSMVEVFSVQNNMRYSELSTVIYRTILGNTAVQKKSKQRNIWNILSQICWIIVCLTIFNVLLTWALLSKKSRVKDKTFVLFNVLWCNRCTFDRLDICFASYKSMSTYLTRRAKVVCGLLIKWS